MTHATKYTHEFVELIPEKLGACVLYVSIRYATVTHLCMCGCGSKIITPLARDQWSLRFDGETVSLKPSIGNWSYPCQSHYWLSHGRVRWARRWTEAEIVEARDRVERRHRSARSGAEVGSTAPKPSASRDRLMVRIRRSLRSLVIRSD